MGENMDIPQKVIDICNLLEEKKAENIVVFDTTKMHNVADYFIVATGSSSTHLNGICDYIEEKSSEIGLVEPKREGFILSTWVVLDFDNILVHLFTNEEREKYSLQKLLSNGKNELSLKKIHSILDNERKKQELLEQKKQQEEKRKENDLKKKLLKEQTTKENQKKKSKNKAVDKKVETANKENLPLEEAETNTQSESLNTKENKKRAKK